MIIRMMLYNKEIRNEILFVLYFRIILLCLFFGVYSLVFGCFRISYIMLNSICIDMSIKVIIIWDFGLMNGGCLVDFLVLLNM